MNDFYALIEWIDDLNDAKFPVRFTLSHTQGLQIMGYDWNLAQSTSPVYTLLTYDQIVWAADVEQLSQIVFRAIKTYFVTYGIEFDE